MAERDETNYDTAIIELWSILEMLTGTLLDRYDVLVRRVSFLGEDVEIDRLVLNHLRCFRNRTVHTGRSSEGRNAAIHQLRSYAEQMLLHHVRNPTRADSIACAMRFLDLSPNVADLKSQANVVKLAIKFRSGGTLRS